MSEPILRLVGVSRQYGVGETSISALSGIDLEVARGELVAIMGASGSGKSTLLSIAGGLAHPTAGEVVVEGRHLSTASPRELALLRRRSLGFVFQDFNLIPAWAIAQTSSNLWLFADTPWVWLAAIAVGLPVAMAAASWIVPPRVPDLSHRTVIA
ncbi:ATP-binding cassette domain-containing protein [Microbacterium luticocti]|uniref:ATP-binding cassette domain-containing protein n=1 Tax=Microbacterium luticocti TaxID=451764 RepID=UPI0004012534|nr:ATP-binding cassette domain-containing protein [Microbacterium luticocti]